MANQIHKKFTDEQVKNLMSRYVKGEIQREDIERLLGIGKTRFFALLKAYREQPATFSVQYKRNYATYHLNPETESNILNELKKTCPSGHITIVLSETILRNSIIRKFR